MSNTIDQFRQTMLAAGLDAPDSLHDDGAIHRFSTNGRRGDTSGWYVVYSDAVAAGAFGCWRAGLQSTWCAKSVNAMTDAEREAHRVRIKAMKAQRDAEEVARHKEEADKATIRWREASASCTHQYLTFKGVQGYGVRQDGDVLLIPVRGIDGKLHSLQTIMPDGAKRFRGRIKGCYHSIGKPLDRLIVCEGYATGASIHEATGDAVAVAFNAGNVGPVATALHRKYPELTLVIAADDDWRTDGNPGLASAKSAALDVGGFVVVPQFPADRPNKATDFNDLAALAGLSAVRACFSEIEVLSC
jgi:putative DNA primase/helicase